MKHKFVIFVMLFLFGRINAQVSTPANFGTITDYVGWNAGQTFPLQIAHKGNQPIEPVRADLQSVRMNLLNIS